jgi:small subunit ribosomal protein S1
MPCPSIVPLADGSQLNRLLPEWSVPESMISESDKPDVPPGAGNPPVPAEPAPVLPRLDQDSLEQEIEAAMGGLSDKDIYGDLNQPRLKQPAGSSEPQRKIGKVVLVRGNDVFVDVPGGRTQGVLAVTQFPEGVPAVGADVEFTIEGYDPENGLLRLSRKGAAQQANWDSVAVGMIVEARVTATNKGGLSVEVNGIRAFLPISQIDLFRVDRPEEYLNQRLLCMVTEVNPQERNLVVSRRAYLEQQREEARDKLWQELAEGQVRTGIVRSVKEFGAFIDLGGVDGLLHISEMSWTRLADPSGVVQPGQSLKVVVLKIDRERRKVSLGLKQLQPSPWEAVAEKYPSGSVVPGKVTRTEKYGAFVELEPGIEGLVHISELAMHRVWRVTDVVKVGQEVQVKVLSIDPAQKRISLSLKAAAPEPVPAAEPEEEETSEPGEEAKPRRPRTTPLRGGIGDE